MYNITGTLMSKDYPVAIIENSVIIEWDDELLPLYLKRDKNIEEWLASRAIDANRSPRSLVMAIVIHAWDVVHS